MLLYLFKKLHNILSSVKHSTVKVWNMSNFSLSGSMLAHQPAVWGVSGLYEHDGTHRALSGELVCYPTIYGFGVSILYMTCACQNFESCDI